MPIQYFLVTRHSSLVSNKESAMKLLTLLVCLFSLPLLFGSALASDNDIEKRVENGYALWVPGRERAKK